MVLESSKWSEYGKIDPEFEKLLETTGSIPTVADTPDVLTAREILVGMINQGITSGQVEMPDYAKVKKEEILIPMRDGTSIRALTYKPSSPPTGGSPLAVLYHGGGWCLGPPEFEEDSCLTFVKLFGGVAVSVDYRLAPEHPFPTAVNDSYDALKWCAANAPKLDADPTTGFIVGGASAGGNISVVLTHLARDEKLSPPLTGSFIKIPLVVHYDARPEKYKSELNSYEQNEKAAILDRRAIEWFIQHYKPEPSNPLFSPLLWPSGHKDLPPAYIQVAGMDLLRDEGLLYERILRTEAGVKTRIDVYPGVPHGFDGVFPMLSQSKKCVEDRIEGFSWLLGKEPLAKPKGVNASV